MTDMHIPVSAEEKLWRAAQERREAVEDLQHMSPIVRNDTVSEVIDGRRGVYGDPTEMFSRAAQIWSGITGYPINATDVPLMLIGYKVLRAQHTPDYSDNSDDIEGYLDIFRELVGNDMIHARSVTEYLEQKEKR